MIKKLKIFWLKKSLFLIKWKMDDYTSCESCGATVYAIDNFECQNCEGGYYNYPSSNESEESSGYG